MAVDVSPIHRTHTFNRIRFMVFKWGLLLSILAIWASSTLVTRDLLVHHWGMPNTLTAVRSTIAFLATALLVLLSRRAGSRFVWRRAYILGGIFLGIQGVLFGLATNFSAASIVGLCFFGAASLVTAVIGIVLTRKLPYIPLLGLVLGFVGLLTVMRPSGVLGIGVLFSIVGGFAWGGYLLWSKHELPPDLMGGLKVNCIAMGIGSLLSWGYAFYTEPHGWSSITSSGWAGSLYMGVIPQAVGYVVFGWLATKLNHIELGVSQFGLPVFVVLGGVWILGESSTWALWVGLGLVVLGMVLASQKHVPKPKQNPA